MNEVLERILALKDGGSLARFCQEVGLSYEKLKKSFQRNTLPNSDSLSKIARHCRVDLQWLITGEGTQSAWTQHMVFNIRQARILKGWSLEDMASRLNVAPQMLELCERGECVPSLELVTALGQSLHIEPRTLLSGGTSGPAQVPDLKIFQATSTQTAPQIKNEDYLSIPLTDSAIAAGHPIIQDNKIEDYVLLHVRAAGKRTNLVASRVDGDSMEPMLASGDIVVIDRNEKDIAKNKMFAVFYEGGMTAKYLERKNNLLILRPINPTADVQIVDLNEHPDPLVGRVIGAWKEF